MLKVAKKATKRRVSAVAICAALLAGCGGSAMTPGPWVGDPGAAEFVDRVGKQCAGKTLGGRSLTELINDASNDLQASNFMDATGELYRGKFSREQYTSDINRFFPEGNNQDGLDCIFSVLGDGGGS